MAENETWHLAGKQMSFENELDNW